jgi:DNA-binding transcriptional LysR family regulator
MRNIDLASLEIFKAVADHGGITRAAASLHRVQSNVTTRVKQLEERLGTKLFVRQRRKLILSPEGRSLLAYADRLLELSAEAESALRNGTPAGTLQIGALESTAATRLPPVLSRYHRAFPAVRIELVIGTTGALVTKVVHGEVEAAFVAEPFTTADLEAQHVFSEDLVLITPTSLPRVRTPQDIGHTTLIAFAAGCSYRRRLESWLGHSHVSPERVMEFGSYHAIVACVASGAGIAIVPRSVIRISRGARAIRVNALPAAIAKARTYLVSRPGHESTALAAFRALLRKPTGGRSSPPAVVRPSRERDSRT